MIKAILKFGLVLFLICLIASLLLSVTYFITNPRIIQQKEKEEREAFLNVLPAATKGFDPVKKDGEILYYKGLAEGGNICGYVFKTTAKGYSSNIDIMAGLTPEGEIAGIKILSQQETPGLGAKIDEVKITLTLGGFIKNLITGKKEKHEKAEPWFQEQFRGKKIEDLVVVKQKTSENIQSITGATITSEAVTDAVKEKAEQILKEIAPK